MARVFSAAKSSDRQAEKNANTIAEMKKTHELELKDWQKRYDELLMEFGSMKGKFELVSEQLNKILDAARPER